ncbi:MAG: GNAT family N-acetyltransferase [Clostridium sp.]|jgi:ribosomal-protein-alanine N-acetyltransferase|nr:GNAT family N-acetyltransferase [Clostridium sp.]
MPKQESPTITTERLILRRKMEADIPKMTAMFDCDEVRKYLGGYPPRDEHSMLKMVRSRKATEWAVTLKDTDEYIGEVMLPKIVDGYLGEIGYLFRQEYWGKGYANEAVSAIVEYAFGALGLKRLFATIDNNNERSKKFIEKLCFEFVALLPEADFGGRVADVAYYTRKAAEV